MKDTIDRQDVIDICNSAIDLWDGLLGCGALVAVKDRISELPSAEPKTGKWIREVLGSTSGYGTTVMYQCTNCEKMSISKYKFCPNCGTKIEREDDD